MVKMTVVEAMDAVLIQETGMIERHFGKGMEHLTSTESLIGTVWALERRLNGNKLDWKELGQWTRRQLNDWFAEEPEGVPEEVTEAGKED